MRAARLAAMRRSYEIGGLDEADLADDWLDQLRRWLREAEDGGVLEPNAMLLATATPAGAPSARTVLHQGPRRAAGWSSTPPTTRARAPSWPRTRVPRSCSHGSSFSAR